MLAIAENAGGEYNAPDGTVGTPYILARGESLAVISDIKLTQTTDTNPVGDPHTVILGWQPWHGRRRSASLDSDRYAAASEGSIVNVSSTAGLRGYPGHDAYGAAKWGLRGLSKVAANELGRHGIRVNSIHPGPIRTDMMPQDEGSLAHYRTFPLGRHGAPEEVADLVCFLASGRSSYITGGEFVIDGGSTA